MEDHRSLIKFGVVGGVCLLFAKAPWMLRAIASLLFPPASWMYGVLVAAVVCLLPLASGYRTNAQKSETRSCAQGVAWGWRAKHQAERSKRVELLRLQHQLRAQAEELAETRRLLRLQKVETNQAMARLKLRDT